MFFKPKKVLEGMLSGLVIDVVDARIGANGAYSFPASIGYNALRSFYDGLRGGTFEEGIVNNLNMAAGRLLESVLSNMLKGAIGYTEGGPNLPLLLAYSTITMGIGNIYFNLKDEPQQRQNIPQLR